MTFDFIAMLLIVKSFKPFYLTIVMILSQFVVYVLIYHYPKFRKGSSITLQDIAINISVALAVALSVCSMTSLHYLF